MASAAEPEGKKGHFFTFKGVKNTKNQNFKNFYYNSSGSKSDTLSVVKYAVFQMNYDARIIKIFLQV